MTTAKIGPGTEYDCSLIMTGPRRPWVVSNSILDSTEKNGVM